MCSRDDDYEFWRRENLCSIERAAGFGNESAQQVLRELEQRPPTPVIGTADPRTPDSPEAEKG